MFCLCKTEIKCMPLSGLVHRCCVPAGGHSALTLGCSPWVLAQSAGMEDCLWPCLTAGSAAPSLGLSDCWECRCRCWCGTAEMWEFFKSLQLAAPEINCFFHWKIVATQFHFAAFQTGTSVRFSCCQCFVMWDFLFMKSKAFTKQASQSPAQFKKYISGSAFLKSSWGML